MQTKVTKWGNSFGVRIPQALAESLGITEDTSVELFADEEVITIKPVRRKESLRELVAKITPANRHSEADWGPPVSVPAKKQGCN